MLASCSLSATINKLSRFMDDSVRAKVNFQAALKRPPPAETKRGNSSDREKNWQGEESATLKTPVRQVLLSARSFSATPSEKENKGGQPAISATAPPGQSSPRGYPFRQRAGKDCPGRTAVRIAPGWRC